MQSSCFDRPHWRNEWDLVDAKYASGEFFMPVHYVLSLTHACNLHCPFCFLRKVKASEAMSTADWLRVLDELPDYARVILFGGEPLMAPGFDEVFASAASRFRVSIVTNGTLLTNAKVDLLLSGRGLTDLNVSIDSVGNWNRHFTEKNWASLRSGLARFNAGRGAHPGQPKLGISVVLLDETAHELLDLHKMAHEELGCDFVNYCLLNGAKLQLADTMAPFEDLYRSEPPPMYAAWDLILEQLTAIRAYDRERGHVSYLRPKVIDVNLDEDTDCLRFLNAPEIETHRFGPCKMPWADCRIHPDGAVTSCLAYSFGNARSRPLQDILQGEEATRFRATLREEGFYPQCKRCVFMYDRKFERTRSAGAPPDLVA